jgi:hypothetical protein
MKLVHVLYKTLIQFPESVFAHSKIVPLPFYFVIILFFIHAIKGGQNSGRGELVRGPVSVPEI